MRSKSPVSYYITGCHLFRSDVTSNGTPAVTTAPGCRLVPSGCRYEKWRNGTRSYFRINGLRDRVPLVPSFLQFLEREKRIVC
jgi:hypothetical protein